MPAPTPVDPGVPMSVLLEAEAARLAALARYDILDSPAEQGYDDLVLLASKICGTPVSLVSLVERGRQWFKAAVGFDPSETPLSQSVCVHGMHRRGLLVIPDLTADARTSANTLVTRDPKIRFYAGARLETPEGLAVGMLCVIDTEPRPGGLTPDQEIALEALARQVVTLMELRRYTATQGAALASQRKAEERQRFLLDLSDLLRKQRSPRARMQAAVDALGRFLGAGRVGYGMILDDGLTVSLETEFVDGVAVLEGLYPLAAFGPGNIANLKSGRTSVYHDVEADPGTAGLGLPGLGVAALVAVPQVHEQRLRSVVYVNQATPRDWFPDEVAVIEDVATRIWDAVERARNDDIMRSMNETLEKQVAERTQERDRIWQVSQDMLGVAESSGAWVSINPAWRQILGWREDEIIGRSLDWLRHPDDQETTRQERARLNQGLQSHDFENRLRAANGDYRTFSWMVVPVGDRHYCVARDVTEEKERAARQAQVEDALRQSQKLEAIGQLTGGVAHDFNNLLTVIKSASDLLKRPNLTEERRARYVGGISDTVDRAARLTGQLLAFARRQALQPKVFDAARNVSAIGEMMGTLTGARIDVRLQLPDVPCFVNADPSQLDTALVNIAVNAPDAMQGEGRLTVAVRQVGQIPAIRSHGTVAGSFVAISISDTGSGIPADHVERIFEPFYTTKPMGEGTGLGLSQVFGFVKQSGGEVVVDSRVGCGTTFTLYLPEAVDPGNRMEGGESPMGFTDGTGLTVLVVEDNREVGTFTASTLQELGYITELAINVDDALAKLAPDWQAFDVVFTDVVMPGRDGVELAREIGQLYPDLPVVLTSGYSTVLAREGTHGFELLQKPYSVQDLANILVRAVGRRRGSA